MEGVATSVEERQNEEEIEGESQQRIHRLHTDRPHRISLAIKTTEVSARAHR